MEKRRALSKSFRGASEVISFNIKKTHYAVRFIIFRVVINGGFDKCFCPAEVGNAERIKGEPCEPSFAYAYVFFCFFPEIKIAFPNCSEKP